jgi:ribonucleoside-diphosphate reductase alpha chain
MMTGEPYIHFIDTANRALPEPLKQRGLKIRQSNLCQEIELPTDENRTAVCCLSSLNLDYYDYWKSDQQFYDDVAEMLDNVLQYFIDNAPDTVYRAKYSAMMERSIGVGALGFHSYLQSKMIPFEGISALYATREIFKSINSGMHVANLKLGELRGSPDDLKGTGLRFAHTMALAPNASSSIIMGNTSPSCEAYKANAYRQDTLSGSFMNKNKHLDKIIKSRFSGEQYDEAWSSIIANDGSCQHLEFLTADEKEVFKTAMEIDQRWVVEHASERQKFIDQGQSINLFFRPDVNIVYLHAVHKLAWEKGLKGLYYCRSEKLKKADKISRSIERKVIEQVKSGEECLMCEG